MSITSSTIEDDDVQVDGRRHILEVHTDHTGQRYEFRWTAAAGQDVTSGLAARATWLADYLAQQEIEANLEEVQSSG